MSPSEREQLTHIKGRAFGATTCFFHGIEKSPPARYGLRHCTQMSRKFYLACLKHDILTALKISRTAVNENNGS